MNNGINNFQDFITAFNNLTANPAQYVMKNFGITQDIANDPDAIINQLMRSGRLSQGRYNAVRRAAMQIQNNPLFQQLVRNK